VRRSVCKGIEVDRSQSVDVLRNTRLCVCLDDIAVDPDVKNIRKGRIYRTYPHLQQEALKAGNLTGALGQQPFLQGFWPVMQLYLEIDRGISAANLDTRAQLVTEENVEEVGGRFEN
jgi:hypothetical protein